MNPNQPYECCNIQPRWMTRREVLKSVSAGFGWLAFQGLSTQLAAAENKNPLAPKAPHFPAKAKRVIFLAMQGGPAHMDTFDYKPKLTADSGKPGNGKGGRLFGSPFQFAQHGQSGLWISELFPNVAKHADELCLLRGMHTDIPNHPQAFVQMHTGSSQFTRPSMGAWTFYGLGTENENLPGFITISPPLALGGAQNFGAAFLPAIYQGTRLGEQKADLGTASIGNIRNPDGRDHNAKGYTMWMAGGGVRGGLSYGSTDDYGAKAVENPVHVHDLHATVLALLGLDHEKLTFRYAGREFRLTDVSGKVVKAIMA